MTWYHTASSLFSRIDVWFNNDITDLASTIWSKVSILFVWGGRVNAYHLIICIHLTITIPSRTRIFFDIENSYSTIWGRVAKICTMCTVIALQLIMDFNHQIINYCMLIVKRLLYFLRISVLGCCLGLFLLLLETTKRLLVQNVFFCSTFHFFIGCHNEWTRRNFILFWMSYSMDGR